VEPQERTSCSDVKGKQRVDGLNRVRHEGSVSFFSFARVVRREVGGLVALMHLVALPAQIGYRYWTYAPVLEACAYEKRDGVVDLAV
jgi:hypothetical protein